MITIDDGRVRSAQIHFRKTRSSRLPGCWRKLRVGDFQGDKLHVIGKGNLRDFVPLPEPAVTTLQQWVRLKRQKGEAVDPKAFLFLGRGDGPMSFSLLRLRWKKMLAMAGLKSHYGLHTLRHTGGLLVYAATGDLAKTARFLRHTDTKTTADFYLHVDAGYNRDFSRLGVTRFHNQSLVEDQTMEALMREAFER